jgi:hypothetical protein
MPNRVEDFPMDNPASFILSCFFVFFLPPKSDWEKKVLEKQVYELNGCLSHQDA